MFRVLCAPRAVPSLLVCALLGCLIGCGKEKEKGSGGPTGATSKLTQENFDKIKTNMAEKDVVDILGAPTETKDVTGGKELTWKSGPSAVTVGIKEGKVEYKAGAIVTIK